MYASVARVENPCYRSAPRAITLRGMIHDEVVPILDFGAQYAQLIARRVREQGVYSVLVRHDVSIDELKRMNARGLILSGGPSSVYEP